MEETSHTHTHNPDNTLMDNLSDPLSQSFDNIDSTNYLFKKGQKGSFKIESLTCKDNEAKTLMIKLISCEDMEDENGGKMPVGSVLNDTINTEPTGKVKNDPGLIQSLFVKSPSGLVRFGQSIGGLTKTILQTNPESLQGKIISLITGIQEEKDGYPRKAIVKEYLRKG